LNKEADRAISNLPHQITLSIPYTSHFQKNSFSLKHTSLYKLTQWQLHKIKTLFQILIQPNPTNEKDNFHTAIQSTPLLVFSVTIQKHPKKIMKQCRAKYNYILS